MRIIKPYHEILASTADPIGLIEQAYRNCYKSEDKIEHGSAEKLIGNCMKLNHATPLEHAGVTVRFVCDRGIMAEITRHRICSFSVESTRYCNYSKNKFRKQITVILPLGFDKGLLSIDYPCGEHWVDHIDNSVFWQIQDTEQESWLNAMHNAENSYMEMLERGTSAEMARSVLPNSLKTEIVMTANLRELKLIFKLRCSKAAHPQIRELLLPLLEELHEKIPVIFDDEYEMYKEAINEST